MFLLCAVKVPDAVTEMMMAEFHHHEACQRINSILKFYTLWRFRYQVWPRMEEGAQQIFKVQNPKQPPGGCPEMLKVGSYETKFLIISQS